MRDALSAVLVIPLVAITGCTKYVREADTPTVAPLGPPTRTDVATVCVYRPTYMGFPFDPKIAVFDNGQLVGATSSYGYFCWLAEPGAHRITFGQGGFADRVHRVRAGERKHLVHQQVPQDLVVVSEDEAKAIIAESEYVVVTAVPDGEKPPDANRVARAMAAE